MRFKKLKATVVTLLSIVLLLSMATPVLATGNQVTIWVDEEQIEYIDQSPFIVEGTTLASAEPLFEKLDIVLIVEEESEMIVGIHDNGAFAMQVGQLMAVVNDAEVELLVAPQIVDETVFVPVRFVSEAAGYDVDWDGSTRQVLITSVNSTSEADASEADASESDAPESDAPEADASEDGDEVAVEGGSRGFLWKTEHGDNTVYLLGSLHVANEAMYPLRTEISEAFYASDYLVVEVDTLQADEEETTALVLALGVYLDGTTLPDHISPELYEQLGDLLSEFGLERDVFDIFKPWYLSLVLQTMSFEEEGFVNAIGIDNALLSAAVEIDMPILELETAELQLKLYAYMSPELQVLMLDDAINGFNEAGQVIYDYAEMWITGDEEMLMAITIQEGGDEEQQAWSKKVLDDRNFNMVEQIDQYLQGEDGATYFVVVGAAHMLGEMGIVQLLEEKGYSVSRE